MTDTPPSSEPDTRIGTAIAAVLVIIVLLGAGGYALVKKMRAAGSHKVNPEDTMPLEDLGKLVFRKKGCISCHSNDGHPGNAAPTHRGLYGTTAKVWVGKDLIDVTVDEAYLRESIVDPLAKIVDRQSVGLSGHWPANMQSYRNQLTDRELDALVAYIVSLRD